MHLIGLGTAAPPHCYSQQQCWEALLTSSQFRRLSSRSQTLLKKLLCGDNGIATRHLVLQPLSEVFQSDPDTLAKRFAHHAPALATEAARRALLQARLAAEQIDGLIISTCTGYLCPGLTSYVSERLALSPGIRLLDLVGHGCGAALPNLQTAAALLGSRQCERVLSVSVEVCSAAFYLDEDPGVLVSACLFGDGAAAAVLSSEPSPHTRRVEWLTSVGTCSPSDRDRLRFEQRGGMLRNVLTKEVPIIAGRFAAKMLAETLQSAAIRREDVTAWILHPGGRNVLLALRDALELREEDVRWSADILRDYGNLSSPSVLFVLEHALNGGAPPGLWWLSSFGAGFSSFGALLKVAP